METVNVNGNLRGKIAPTIAAIEGESNRGSEKLTTAKTLLKAVIELLEGI